MDPFFISSPLTLAFVVQRVCGGLFCKIEKNDECLVIYDDVVGRRVSEKCLMASKGN